MSENKRWKFFHNGYTWWLRIESLEQLMRYFELTDEMTEADFKENKILTRYF